MLALRLFWSVFAFWYMQWESTSYLVSTRMNDDKFELKKRIRYKGAVIYRHSFWKHTGVCRRVC